MNRTALNTKFERAEDSPGFLLWQVTNRWQAQQRAALKVFGLTHVQFVLLATLTYVSGKSSFTQKQLSQYAQTDAMMTSQVARKLERKGLITRRPHSTDGRAFYINPTREGMWLANQAVKKVEEVDGEFFAELKADLPIFVSMMKRLATTPRF